MVLKKILLRLAVADALRFENETLAALRGLLADAESPSDRTFLEQLIAEEQTHVDHLNELRGSAAAVPPPAEAPGDLPAAPRVGDLSGPLRDRLREILDKERAAADFYAGLAERTALPGAGETFAHIAAEERGHARRLLASLERRDKTTP